MVHVKNHYVLPKKLDSDIIFLFDVGISQRVSCRAIGIDGFYMFGCLKPKLKPWNLIKHEFQLQGMIFAG